MRIERTGVSGDADTDGITSQDRLGLDVAPDPADGTAARNKPTARCECVLLGGVTLS